MLVNEALFSDNRQKSCRNQKSGVRSGIEVKLFKKPIYGAENQFSVQKMAFTGKKKRESRVPVGNPFPTQWDNQRCFGKQINELVGLLRDGRNVW
jgi:hypothetical protein